MGNIFLSENEGDLSIVEKMPRNKKGVFLSTDELVILQQVYIHKVLSSSDLHLLYAAYRNLSKKQAITRRLRRLVESRILIRREGFKSSSGHFVVYYYALARKGRLALEAMQLIPRGTVDREQGAVRVPSEHNIFATSKMVECTLAFRDMYKYEMLRGINKSPFSVIQNDMVIPDYCITVDNRLICIEFDMGTEALVQLANKTQKYLDYQKQGVFENVEPFILFVCKNTASSSRPYRRIQNIKAAHGAYYDELENLPVYVVSEADFLQLLELLLGKKYPIYQYEQAMINTDASYFMRRKFSHERGWKASLVDSNKLLTPSVANEITTYISSAMKFYSYRGVYKTIVFITAELGSVRSYLALQRYVNELKLTNSTLFLQEYLPVEMIVTFPYLSNDTLYEERLGIQPNIDTRLQTEDEILQALARLDAQGGDVHLSENFYETKYIQLITRFRQMWKKG